VTSPLVLAVDGGNSKTDLALVRATGEVLALVRGPQSSPHHLGVQGCLGVVDDLLARALEQAKLPNGTGPVADVGHLLLAGVDFPIEVEELEMAAGLHHLAARVSVANDTFAVLRAGTERGWGVAVVCGSGINCVGVAPDGRHARFPALGAITGDWGGGFDIGLAAVSAAARSEDGRGPHTTLQRAVPAHFGLSTPSELAQAIHRKEIDLSRVVELAPVVLAEAATDAVAGSIVERLGEEVVALVRVVLLRLRLTGAPVEVVLGGGLFRSGDSRLTTAVQRAVGDIAPDAVVHAVSPPPIVGAALLGLDELGAGPGAEARLRRELGAAFEHLGDGVGTVSGSRRRGQGPKQQAGRKE
jgi:N-acetylglucosamine kinase-like BadF-type ATPase